MKDLIQNIFSVKNINSHKQLCILGFKIKIKNKSINTDNHIDNEILENIKKHTNNEVFVANYIKDLHQKTFPKYKRCNYNSEIVLVATGLTLKYFMPIVDKKYIGVNKAYQRKDIQYDYLFTHDYNANKTYIDDIIKYPAEIFLGTFYTKSDSNIDVYKMPMKYRYNDNINYYISDYTRNLCYPELEYFPLMDFGSISFSAIHFALYTHPSKIYLVGCDCGNKYFDGTNTDNDFSYMVEGWKKIKHFQQTYYPDVELISINPIGLKGLFKDVYTQEYLDVNPELFDDTNDIEILKMENY